jgi:hypothetical protein
VQILDAFAAVFISNHPFWADFLTVVTVVGLFLVAPIGLFVVLKTKYNQGRYVFQKRQLQASTEHSGEHLYLLDTIKGTLYFVEGNYRYKRMVIDDRGGVEKINKGKD